MCVCPRERREGEKKVTKETALSAFREVFVERKRRERVGKEKHQTHT